MVSYGFLLEQVNKIDSKTVNPLDLNISDVKKEARQKITQFWVKCEITLINYELRCIFS